MHILLAILGVASTIGMILWRARGAAHAAHEVVDAAQGVRLFFRRTKWRKKVNTDMLKRIDDPREAAAAMMVAIAEQDGLLTQRMSETLIAMMMSEFQVAERQADELMQRGRWLAKDAGDLGQFLRRLSAPVRRHCTTAERAALQEMLLSSVDRDGASADRVLETLSRLEV